MSIAKGRVFVSKEKLLEILGLPKDVEVLSIKELELMGAYEFIVVSAEETNVTKKDIPLGHMKRISVDTLLKQQEEIVIETTLVGGEIIKLLSKETILPKKQADEIFNINITNVNKPKETDIQKIAKDIFDNIKKNDRDRK